MKKRIFSLLAAMVCLAVLSFSAFATDYYASDESESETVPKYIDQLTVSKAQVDISIPNTGESKDKSITPVGNLTLIDDISEIESYSNDENKSKEFLTVTTKSGNTFYIIVDRSGDQENVYFLNLVDEADIMALIKGNSVEYTTVKETTTKAKSETKDNETNSENKSSKSGTIFIVFVMLVGGGFAVYWLKFRNTPKSGSAVNDKDDDDDLSVIDVWQMNDEKGISNNNEKYENF